MARTYQVRVITPIGRSSFITTAGSGISAITQAMQHYPNATAVSAKPVATRILG